MHRWDWLFHTNSSSLSAAAEVIVPIKNPCFLQHVSEIDECIQKGRVKLSSLEIKRGLLHEKNVHVLEVEQTSPLQTVPDKY